MTFISRSEETNQSDRKVSVWFLSELLRWSELGLLPENRNTDIEYYCSFLGAYEVASCFQGIAVLVHGPSGCVESFTATRPFYCGVQKYKPRALSTNMRMDDVVYGGTAKLSRAIEDVDEKYKPELIVVLTNCCADIIGEDIESVIRKAVGRVKADVIRVETGGCSGNGFRKGADEIFESLIDHVAEKAGTVDTERETSINIFTKRISGRPAEVQEVAELRRILGKIGVGINAVVQLGTSYQDLLRIPRARANASLCYLFGDGPMKHLEKRFKQPFAKATFPIGLKGTLDWIQDIAEVLGIDCEGLLNGQEVEDYRRKLEKARKRYEGREAFIWMHAEKGLAMARFVTELGMKPCLYSMGYFMVRELKDTISMALEKGYDFPAVLTGKQDIMLEYSGLPPSERPLLFMPRKFWTGGLPTATVNFFSDPILGFAGIDNLLASIERAANRAGKKDYSLFNRYIETRFDAVNWDIEGPAIRGMSNEQR